jgi:cardiolipin synthase
LLRHLPNALTLLRILLVGPIVWWLMHGDYPRTLVAFAGAAATDAVDGFLAKRFGWTSALGKILDPLADKLLLVAVFVTLGVLGFVPLWLTALVVARDVVIGVGALLFHVSFGELGGRPTQISKLNTLCQIAFVLAVTAGAAGSDLAGSLVMVLGGLVVVTTVVSGLDYVIRYARRAAAISRERAGR